jgi:hypothetical protein
MTIVARKFLHNARSEELLLSCPEGLELLAFESTF